jgi:hypothetical protein
MKPGALPGLIAGATGTVALNIATYADMALRGRPSSNIPAQLVDTFAEKTGIVHTSEEERSHNQTIQNRESGIGALLGYVNGLGVGWLYGLLRSKMENTSIPLASIGVGAAAMIASDVPIIASKISDPKSWGFSGWVADALPHLGYGLITVLTYESLITQHEDIDMQQQKRVQGFSTLFRYYPFKRPYSSQGKGYNYESSGFP